MSVLMTLDFDFTSFTRELSKTLQSRIHAQLRRVALEAQNLAQAQLRQQLQLHKTYESLIRGELRFQLGLEDDTLVNLVVEAAVRGVRAIVDLRPGGHEVAGNIVITLFANLAQEAAGYAGGSYVSTNQRGRSTVIPWLDWLLFQGQNRVTIASYEFVPGHPQSRTEGGIMVYPSRGRQLSKKRRPYSKNARQSDINRRKGGWHVPEKFAGTAASNWMIEAAQETELVLYPQLEYLLAHLGDL